ncbi:DUF2730 domain-containing protein, partial [Escherichia coli]|nr:DUF2730 domain-containing protein [Escherichia coli]
RSVSYQNELLLEQAVRKKTQ